MANVTRSQASTMLTALGWRTNTAARLTQAIKDFQRMWNLGTALSVDGIIGPKTSEALRLSYARRKQGKSDISAHFSAREFACKCGGRYSGCRRIWTTRAALQLAERIRRIKDRPFTPVSGCRCTQHNRAVGGATQSKHLLGQGFDIPSSLGLTRTQARQAGALGIGYGGRTGRVIHTDTGPSRTWVYSNS